MIPPPRARGKKILVSVEPFALDESIPEEADIEWAMKRIFSNRSMGTSDMRVGYLE